MPDAGDGAKAEGEGGEGEGEGEGEEENDEDEDGEDGDPDPDADPDAEPEEEEEEEEDDDDDGEPEDDDVSPRRRPARRKSRGRRPATSATSPEPGTVKPQSAYMLFVNSRRKELMADQPGITMPEVGRKCGEMWRAMGPEERAEFQVPFRSVLFPFTWRVLEFQRPHFQSSCTHHKRSLGVQAQSDALRKASNRGGKKRDSDDEAATGRPQRAKGGQKRQRKGSAEGAEAAAAGAAEVAGADEGTAHQGEAGWAPSLLHDGGEGSATAIADVSGDGGTAAAEEGRAELVAFELPAANASAATAAGGEDGGGDILCDESGGGLGVDGDAVGGLGDEHGGLDDGLGGL